MSAPDRQAQTLPEAARRVHLALIQSYAEQGAVPSSERLAARAGIAVTDLPDRLRELMAADYVAFDDAGRLTCLYPFSATPTSHVVIIGGQPRYAMCAIDAIGIPAMLDRQLAIEGRCAVCDTPIALTVRPGAIVDVAPPAATIVARRDEAEPAFAACCPFTVFACGQDHAEQFLRRISGAQILPLAEALTHAENIFGGMLADALPANRPRGKRWHSPAAIAPILYTQPGCAESGQVRSWLTGHGIAFTERDASGDRDAANALVATGAFATPLLVVGDRQILGFQPNALAALVMSGKTGNADVAPVMNGDDSPELT